MFRRSTKSWTELLLAVLFACWILAPAAFGQSNQTQASQAQSQAAQQTTTAPPAAPAVKSKAPAFLASRSVDPRAIRQYQLRWGIDNVVVKQVASGALIRFSYRVVDPVKAKELNDEKLKPQLIDQASNAALQIPEAEQYGQLRQTGAPVMGREYWVVFSNRGGYVKPGNRVDFVVGNVRLIGLIVQ